MEVDLDKIRAQVRAEMEVEASIDDALELLLGYGMATPDVRKKVHSLLEAESPKIRDAFERLRNRLAQAEDQSHKPKK
jgi:hypothetical protein